MVDRDEEEENKTEASRDIRRREAELFGESFEEDELNDNTSANDERSNDDNNNTGDEDDTTEKNEGESADDDERFSGSQNVSTQVARRTLTSDTYTEQVMGQTAVRVEIQSTGKTTKITEKSSDGAGKVKKHSARKATEITDKASDVAKRVEIQSAAKTTKITGKSGADAESVKKQSAKKTTENTEKSSDNTERVKNQTVGKTTEITNKSSDDAGRVEIQSAGKTTELTNRSSDCAERVEIQSAGKSTKITDKPIDDTETVKKQSANKTTEITKKSSDNAERVEIESVGKTTDADQATRRRGNQTSDKNITPPVTIEIQSGTKHKEIPKSHIGPEMVETQSRGEINEKETSKSHEESIEQIALDGSIEQIADGQQKIFEHFQNMVHDSILQIHLLYIPLFVHWDDVTVVAQPLVNHRALSIQNIKSKDFRRKMQQEGSDFAEEMHAVIYELRKKDNGENLSSVPIYSTYVINPDQSIEHELTDVEAVYPTVQGLKSCAKALGVQYRIANNSASTIKQLFERIINKASLQALLQGHQLETVEDNTVRPNNSQTMQTQWNSLKQEIMSQPIRIALLNGLQRCGLVAHMLGNKVLHNSVARDATKDTYKFTSDSGLKTVIPLHIMLPKTQQFDATFVKSCSEYSKIVQLRKYESFQTTIKAQLYEILASTGHVTCKAINEKRLIHHTFWTERTVSKKKQIIRQKFIDLEKIT